MVGGASFGRGGPIRDLPFPGELPTLLGEFSVSWRALEGSRHFLYQQELPA